MENTRTLKGLRESLKGKIYVWFDSQKTCKRFLQDAENEGYRFGKAKPTQCGTANIIALGKSQLSYLGFTGYMAFQCNGGDGSEGRFHRIDYRKYINGAANYRYGDTDSAPKETKFKGKFHDVVTIIGDNRAEALKYIKSNLPKCKNADEEEELYCKVWNKFDVVVTHDDDEFE